MQRGIVSKYFSSLIPLNIQQIGRRTGRLLSMFKKYWNVVGWKAHQTFKNPDFYRNGAKNKYLEYSVRMPTEEKCWSLYPKRSKFLLEMSSLNTRPRNELKRSQDSKPRIQQLSLFTSERSFKALPIDIFGLRYASVPVHSMVLCSALTVSLHQKFSNALDIENFFCIKFNLVRRWLKFLTFCIFVKPGDASKLRMTCVVNTESDSDDSIQRPEFHSQGCFGVLRNEADGYIGSI